MTGSTLLVFAATVIVAAGCGGGETLAKPASPQEAADEIRAVERARLQALVARDLVTARELHADDFELTTPTGDSYSKKQYLEAVGSGRLDYVVWEPISPIRVSVQGDKAVVRYRSKIGFAGNFGGTTEQSHTDTYERRGGRWQIVRSLTTGDG